MRKISSLLMVCMLIVSGLVLATPAEVGAQDGGLVACWDFEDGSGQYLSDSSGNANTGTLGSTASADTRDPTWSQGATGGGMLFDGIDDCVNIPDSDSIDTVYTANSFTVAAWIYQNSRASNDWTKTQFIFEKGLSDRNPGNIQLYCGAGEANPGFNIGMRFDSSDPTYGVGISTDATDYPLQTWVFLTGSYDGETLRLYVNGELKNSKYYGKTLTFSTESARIGCFNWDSYSLKYPFDGKIDGVRLYSRALSDAEIEALAVHSEITAEEVHIKPLYPLTDPEQRKVYRGVELNACFQTTDAAGNALNDVSVSFSRSDEIDTREQFTSQNQVYSNNIADDGVIKIDWAISLTYSEPTFTIYIESDAQYMGESVTLVFDDLAEYTYVVQDEMVTSWNINRDTYSFGNFETNVNPGGCCYGLTSTALLYFYHYQLGINQYPYFPLQDYLASTTRDLNIAFDWENYYYDNQNIIDNVVLAIITHQQFDKGRYVAFSTDPYIRSENRTQEFTKLCQNLSEGHPVILGVGNVVGGSVLNAHSVIAWSLYYTSNNNVIINISDPNAPNIIRQASYDIETTIFEYGGRSEFMLRPCKLLTKSSLTIPNCNVFTELLPPGYWIVIADKMVHIHNINEPSQINKFTESGNSQSFVMGIPDSAGITEGEIQVYAIPQSISPQIDDPSTTPSSLMVTRVTNESGNRAGYGFALNISSDTQYDYELIPSDNGFNITPKNSTVNLNVTLFSADSNGYYVFKTTNISIPENTRAEFIVTDWDGLNSTTTSSVTLNLYDEGSSTPKDTYELTNGQDFILISGGREITFIVIIVGVVIIAAVAIMSYIRRKHKPHQTKSGDAQELVEEQQDNTERK